MTSKLPEEVVVERLDWDSNFFGFAIGRVNLDKLDLSDPSMLEVIDDQAISVGIQCLYASLDPVRRVDTVTLQEHGYRFVDASVLTTRSTADAPVPASRHFAMRAGHEQDYDRLAPLVDELAPWSRFAVDQRFGLEQARRLQRAWMRRAVDVTAPGYGVELAENESGVLAFITWCDQGNRIDGIAATRGRGASAAQALFHRQCHAAPASQILGGPIAARNVAALNFIYRCGFRLQSTRYNYHRWLD
jgi:dTDP-4-amino-4,6-dideoxy-D-galactose acyltransferase